MTMEEKKAARTPKTEITGNDHIVFFLITVCVDLGAMLFLSTAAIISKYSEVQKESIIICFSGVFTIAFVLFVLRWLRKETWQYIVPFVITAVLTATGA